MRFRYRLAALVASAGLASFLIFAAVFAAAGERRFREALSRAEAALKSRDARLAELAAGLERSSAEYAVCASSLGDYACKSDSGYALIGAIVPCSEGGKPGLRSCYLSGGSRPHAQWTTCAAGTKPNEMRRYMGNIWRNVILPERPGGPIRSYQHQKLLAGFEPP